MPLIAYVDPGVHFHGVAYFEGVHLRFAEYRPSERPLSPVCFLGVITECHCERPQVLPNAGTRWSGVRISDQLDLTLAAGRMTGALPTKYYYPTQWKGQLSKDVHHARMEKALTSEEKLILGSVQCRPSLIHNVKDAICMGLHFTGRI